MSFEADVFNFLSIVVVVLKKLNVLEVVDSEQFHLRNVYINAVVLRLRLMFYMF